MLSSSGFNAAIACCRLDGCRSEKKLSWLVVHRHTRRWDSGEISSRDWPLLLAEGAVQWFIRRPSMATAVHGGGAVTGPALLREAEDGQLCGVYRGSFGRRFLWVWEAAGWGQGKTLSGNLVFRGKGGLWLGVAALMREYWLFRWGRARLARMRGEEIKNQKSKTPFSQGFLWFCSPERGRVASCPLFVWGSLRFAFPRPKEGGGLFFCFQGWWLQRRWKLGFFTF